MPKRPFDHDDAVPMDDRNAQQTDLERVEQSQTIYKVMRHDAIANSIAQMVASERGTHIRFGSGSNAEIEALRGMVIALSVRCGELEDLIEQHAVNNPPPTILERIQQAN